MKKIIFCLTAACMSLTFFPLQSIAQKQTTPETSSLVVTKTSESLKPIESRTTQQNYKVTTAKKDSKLNSSDKKDLQQIEVRSDGYYHHHSGVYISVGGAILIIFILIVLF